jgi:hypothetical protein
MTTGTETKATEIGMTEKEWTETEILELKGIRGQTGIE